jgi:hypothetical protein
MTHVQIRKVNWDAEDDSMCAVEDGGFKYQDYSVDYSAFCVLLKGEIVLQVIVRGGLKGDDDELIEITGEDPVYLKAIERALKHSREMLYPSNMCERGWTEALKEALHCY